MFFFNLFIAMTISASAFARDVSDSIYTGTADKPVSLSDITAQVTPGSIVVIGEIHSIVGHHDNESLLLTWLRGIQANVNVGMEFFTYTKQNSVNQFLRGEMREDDFLKDIGWGSIPFDLYRQQVFFPHTKNGTTLALNAPADLTRKISRTGVDSLNDAEKALMPPEFAVGNSLYYERFVETMGGHGNGFDEAKMQRWFAAQSTWDDTMAWQAVEFMKAHPNEVLVIIVGDFHVQYGGGLPDRIRARGHQNLITISQVSTFGLSEQEAQAQRTTHPRYGDRADFIWESKEQE